MHCLAQMGFSSVTCSRYLSIMPSILPSTSHFALRAISASPRMRTYELPLLAIAMNLSMCG